MTAAFDLPEPFSVTHWTRPVIGRNPAGQKKYGDPVPRARTVRGFQPAGEEENQTAQLAGRKVTELVMLTADGDWPADSMVELEDGRQFEVNGDVQDFNLGPFGFQAGFAVNLRKVTDGPS